jgi:Tfp pilus assembly protein PilO
MNYEKVVPILKDLLYRHSEEFNDEAAELMIQDAAVDLVKYISEQNKNANGNQLEPLVRQLPSDKEIVKILLDSEIRGIEEDLSISVIPSIQRSQYPELANKIRQAFIDARQSA